MIENFILLGSALFAFSVIAVVGEYLAKKYEWN